VRREPRALASVVLGVGVVAALALGVFPMDAARRASPTGPVARPFVSAEGLIYVSGLTAVPPPASLQPPGSAGIETQTRGVLDALGRILQTASSSLGDVVNVNVYLARATDFDAMNAAYRTYFPVNPPARTTVAADLPVGALIQVSAIAVPTGTSRLTLQPATWAKSPRPYSYIVRTGDLVFLSGLVSRRGTDDAVVPGPVSTQAKTVLDNAGTLLRAAGLTYDNVVAARVFLTDDSEFLGMNDVYRRYFPSNPPARATTVVGLMGPDASVEISLIASSLPKEVIGPQVSPTVPVSTAIRAGRRVFMSGVLGVTDTNLNDATAQTQELLNRVSKTLDLANLRFADLVETTLYLPDLTQQPKIDDVYSGFFPTDPPARTVVGTRLVTPTGLVEMIMTAVGR
jgi:2-iminobutanoate/2-iminopropanoate deaminase